MSDQTFDYCPACGGGVFCKLRRSSHGDVIATEFHCVVGGFICDDGHVWRTVDSRHIKAMKCRVDKGRTPTPIDDKAAPPKFPFTHIKSMLSPCVVYVPSGAVDPRYPNLLTSTTGGWYYVREDGTLSPHFAMEIDAKTALDKYAAELMDGYQQTQEYLNQVKANEPRNT